MRTLTIICASFVAWGCNCDPGGTHQGAGALKVVENQLDFGQTCPRPQDPGFAVEGSTRLLHLRNEENAEVYVNRFEIEAGRADQFLVDAARVPKSLGALGEVEVPITFIPKSAGTVVADLAVQGEDASQSFVVKLLGEGKNGNPLPVLGMSCPGGEFSGDGCAGATPNVFFLDTPVNTFSEMVLVLSNTGCPTLKATEIAVTTDSTVEEPAPADTFALAPDHAASLDVPNGAADRTVRLRFSPQFTNTFTGKLSFKTNDPSQLAVVVLPLRGAGIVPVLDVSPTLCDFSPLASPCTGRFTVSNSGQDALTLTSVALDSPNPMFEITTAPQAGTVLEANGHVTDAIVVTYHPRATGLPATLIVESSGGRATVELRGGSPPVLATEPAAWVDFGDGLTPDTDVFRPLLIKNLATYNGQLPLTLAGLGFASNPKNVFFVDATVGSPCAVSAQPAPNAQLAPGDSIEACLRYRSLPNGGDGDYADLKILSDDPAFPDAKPYLVSLTASTTCNPAPVAVVTAPSWVACSDNGPCQAVDGSATCDTPNRTCVLGGIPLRIGCGQPSECAGLPGQATCLAGICQAQGTPQVSLASCGIACAVPVTLSGEGSFDLVPDVASGDCTVEDRAGVTEWKWQLASSPAGSAYRTTPPVWHNQRGTASRVTLEVDRAGTYVVRLVAFDATRLESPVTDFTVTATTN